MTLSTRDVIRLDRLRQLQFRRHLAIEDGCQGVSDSESRHVEPGLQSRTSNMRKNSTPLPGISDIAPQRMSGLLWLLNKRMILADSRLAGNNVETRSPDPILAKGFGKCIRINE